MEKVFPTILMALDFIAAVPYAFKGDVKMCPEVERPPGKAAGSGTRAAQRRNPGTSHGGR